MKNKQELIKLIPNCPRCGTKLIIVNATPKGKSAISHAATLDDKDGLVCYQCHRIKVKREELNRLPFWPRVKKKIDNLTGVLSYFRSVKRRFNKFIYVRVKGNIPNGRA
jgi:hypothetical protein